MATTFVEYTGNGGATKQFTFPSYQSSDVKVRVDGVLKTAGNHYNITNYTTTGGGDVVFTSGNIPSSPANIRIYRDTNVDTAKATFTAGSSVKAADLNNNTTQLLYRAQEEQIPNLIHSYDIDAEAIETSNIKADAITNAKIADDQIDSEHYVAGSIDLEHMSANSIDSDQYVDGSIDEVHISNSAVTQNKLANNSVGTPELLNGSVTTAKLAANAVDAAKLADDSVDTNAVQNDAITYSKIQNVSATDRVLGRDSSGAGVIEEIAPVQLRTMINVEDGATADQTASEIKTLLQSDKLTASEIANGTITSTQIATGTLDGRYFTETELTNGALDGRYFTETEADARYFNISTGDTIKDGDTFPDNDTTIATTAAINDRIIDLVDDVGGFVPIANETSFPTANPDVNNGSGTLVSIKTISSTRTPSSGTVTIANGAGTGNTVTITGCGSTVLTAGFGIIVETTSTLHTYAFHRLVPKATEVTTVAGISSNITTVANNTANINAVAADASDIGIVAADGTDIGLVAGSISNVNTTAGSIANVNTVAGSISNVNAVGSNISNVNAVNSNESNINSAVSNASNINSAVSNASNINTVAGSISNVNTTATNISSVNNVSSNISNVNNFNDKYQIAANNPTTDGGGNALAAGDLYFNTSANELKVYNGGAWQAGVTATGNFAVTTGNTFTGNNIFTAHTTHNDNVKAQFGTGVDLQLYHDGSNSYIDEAGTGGLYIRVAGTANNGFYKYANNEALATFQPDNAVRLYYDNSKKFETTSTGISVTGNGVFTGNVAVNDNSHVYVGNSGDLDLFHNTQDCFIRSNTGVLKIQTGTENAITATKNAQVELYYDNVKKFETDSLGTIVTGRMLFGDSSGVNDHRLKFGDSGDLQIYHDGSHSRIQDAGTGKLILQGSEINLNNSDSSEYGLRVIEDGAVELYHNGTKKLETTANGIELPASNSIFLGGKIDMTDSSSTSTGRILLGTGDDLQIYHNGSNSFITNSTGDLIVDSGSTSSTVLRSRFDSTVFNNAANNQNQLILDGGIVKLYTSGTERFRTTTSGVLVTGDAVSDGIFQAKSSNSGKWVRMYGSAGTGRWDIYGHGANLRISDNDNAGSFVVDRNTDLNGGLDVTGTITATDHVTLTTDNKRFMAGASNDVRMYHDGTNSYFDSLTGNLYIYNHASTKSIFFGTEGATKWKIMDSGHYIPNADSTSDIGTNTVRVRNGYFDTLYGDGSNLTGINTDLVSDTSPQLGGNLDVNGRNIQFGHCSSAGSDDTLMFGSNGNDLEIFHGGNGQFDVNTGNIEIRNTGSFGSTRKIHLRARVDEGSVTCNSDGGVELYYDNSKKIQTTTSGFQMYGHLFADDDKRIKLGNSQDLQIYHNGTDSYVSNGTNKLRIGNTHNNSIKFFTQNSTRWNIDGSGHFIPDSNNTFDIGSSSYRVRNIYTNDFHLSNEGSSNDIDGTWGDWTIQEGESDLFLKNNRSGKKYKFNLMEVS